MSARFAGEGVSIVPKEVRTGEEFVNGGAPAKVTMLTAAREAVLYFRPHYVPSLYFHKPDLIIKQTSTIREDTEIRYYLILRLRAARPAARKIWDLTFALDKLSFCATSGAV